jgi:GHMP kinases N terminal domain
VDYLNLILSGCIPLAEKATSQGSVWSQLPTALGIGSSAAAVIAALWGLFRLGRKVWMLTAGRRRAQAAILDKLACGSSVWFIEAQLGVAQFVRQVDFRDQRIYRLPGAWVTVELMDNVVTFSITITSAKMYYSTKRLTFGQLDLRLGQDTFAKAPDTFDGERRWIGARRSGYLRHYWFGNPGGYQNYWLSYNDAGAGEIAVSGLAPADFEYASGKYGEKGSVPQNPSSIVVNTLTVLSPERRPEDLLPRNVLGVDQDVVRLASDWLRG